MTTSTRDRRRHERIGVPVCAWLAFPGHGKATATACLDMSQEGAQFSALDAIAVGTSALVNIQLPPKGGFIECKGRVAWSRLKENGLQHFGIRFIDLTYEETERLAGFLASLRPEPVLAAV